MSRALTVNDVVLIDGTGAPAVPGTRVVVEDGVIVAVEQDAGHDDGPHVVQGHGRWLLPGLWDTHMHHGFSAGGLTSAEELSAEQLLLNWRAYLRSGVTSVVSTGVEVTDVREHLIGGPSDLDGLPQVEPHSMPPIVRPYVRVSGDEPSAAAARSSSRAFALLTHLAGRY